ncbi:MAG TPA: hypothetical protein VFM38_03100 [Candidatus Limnocylindrales bacterium]|nr:hypothetical protein [Candidatus Limnocylindrales bacterium]
MDSSDETTRDATGAGSLRFRLSADRLGVQADISLRDAGERWVSIADTGGHRVTGIGPTPRAAVVASLAGLQPAAVRELLADLRLLEVSLRIREASAG